MRALLRPVTRAVTYTRWLHMLVGVAVVVISGFVFPGSSPVSWILAAQIPVPLLLLAATVPAMRVAEGIQARIMLLPGPHARVQDGTGVRGAAGIVALPSASWRDRARTAVWLVLRLEVGGAVGVVTVQLLALSLGLVGAATGQVGDTASVVDPAGDHWAYGLLVPVVLLALIHLMAGAGELMTMAARRLLGPSPAERLADLEERTEQLLERNRIARELHDSIGHALTVAVVQAGAARAAGSPEFTDQALGAIEETGRAALEDLERVLLVLREAERPPSSRPTLADADRLLDSARTSGAKVDAEVSGPIEQVPGPVSREGYRILQEALTNVLRHSDAEAGVRVRIAVADRRLDLLVTNPLAGAAQGPGSGSGLRGIRERAALLGGRARTGPHEDEWQVHVELPIT
ncbi:histidine kinase [Streptomyces sp. NBC_01304]|nr:histidine kinase [Streptomyces sp. NBC_01304]